MFFAVQGIMKGSISFNPTNRLKQDNLGKTIDLSII